MGVVDQVAVTMMIMITDSVNEDDVVEDDNGDNGVDENVGDAVMVTPARGCQEVGHFTSFLNYQSVRGNFPRC